MPEADADNQWRANWEREARALLNDLLLLHFHQALWRETSTAISENAPDADRTWTMHYTKLYIDSQAMAIRRVVRSKAKDPHISLSELLVRVESRPDSTERAASDVRRDRANLNRLVDEVIAWADQNIAHVHLEATAVEPDMTQLDTAIESVGRTFMDYFGLVTRIHMVVDDPLPSPRWRSIFYGPLFPAPPWWPPQERR